MNRLSLPLLLTLLPCALPAAALAAAATVPMVYDRHLVLVGVRIANSGPYTFLLDTDTTPSAIDTALARKLRLRFAGPAGAGSGVGNGASVVLALTIPTLSVGEVTETNVAALATDLSAIGKRLHRTIYGVLGTSFLNRRVLRIDYRCRSIDFEPAAAPSPFTARFNSGDQNVSTDVWVGSRRVRATFDTGDAGYLLVTAKGMAALPTLSRNGRASVVAGYNGTAKVTHATLTGLRIGNVRLPPIDAIILPSDSSPYDINIGNRTLERFVATFDYRRKVVTLSAPRDCVPR